MFHLSVVLPWYAWQPTGPPSIVPVILIVPLIRIPLIDIPLYVKLNIVLANPVH